MFPLVLKIFAGVVNAPGDITRFIGDSDGLSAGVARFVMNIVDWLLGFFGLGGDTAVVTVLYSGVVFGLSVVSGYVVQLIVLKTVMLLARHWNSDIYQSLARHDFFHKVCRIIPPLVFLILIQFSLSNHDVLSSVLTKITVVYIVFVIAAALTALLSAVWQHVDARANKRKLPLNGLAQLVKIAVWIIAVFIIVAVILDKSPASLLAGLGAFSAVLMLIFKDNILGVVAGVQLSENDSLHLGDWIAVPGTDANGTVQEVSLVAVKVLNWDKTTTTLPPYSLISSGFTNYRTMQESNTRRICRSFMIDADSVLPATPEMLDKIRGVPFMDEYITIKLARQAAGDAHAADSSAGLVNGTVDTNLGLFRAYVKMWLDARPDIAHDSDCFVSTLPQTPAGIPLRVYCFTATSDWISYEGIQDSVFEHIAAMLPAFMLCTFENPSGRDTVAGGYFSNGGDVDSVCGVPYPFFRNAAL